MGTAAARTAGDRAGRVALDVVERTVDAALSGPALERLIHQVLGHPQTARLVAGLLEDPATARLVRQVIDSPVLTAGVDELLEREELWTLVDRIARSESVAEAISHQSLGMADQVAVEVGARSRAVDDRLERVARRVLRRDQRSVPGVTVQPALNGTAGP